MTPLTLSALTFDEFRLAAGVYSTGDALHVFLTESKFVAGVRAAIASEHVSGADVEQFVRSQLANFKPGQKLASDTTLAAVAVALTYVPSAFAGKFLQELSRVDVSEIPLAPRVAARAWAQRGLSIAGDTAKKVVLDGGVGFAHAPGTIIVTGTATTAV